jgi:hypothetical protein
MGRPALTVARFDIMNSDSNVNDNKKDNDIPENVTIREEYIKCGNPACQKCNIDSHGPYLYAYGKPSVVGQRSFCLNLRYLTRTAYSDALADLIPLKGICFHYFLSSGFCK